MSFDQQKVLIAHPGTQHSYELAKQLERHGYLFEHWTGFALHKSSLLNKIITIFATKGIKNKISNRYVKQNDSNTLRTNFLIELHKWKLFTNNNILKRNENFQLKISEKSLEKSDIIIGFDTSSWIIAEKAKRLNKIFILEQTTCHSSTKKKYDEHLSSIYPKWDKFKPLEYASGFIEKEKIEHDLADYIVVPSHFVKTSLIENNVEEKKIIINPYGFDNKHFVNNRTRDYATTPIIFLFVGNLTTNKGLPDLLISWEAIDPKNAELWIVGSGRIPYDPITKSIKFLGRLDKRTLANIYNLAHIFILPSYYEGMSIAQLEAFATGLPIISTFNTGIERIIEDKVNGLLIKPGDIKAISDSIICCINGVYNLEMMSRNSYFSSKNINWDSYGDRWNRIIKEIGCL